MTFLLVKYDDVSGKYRPVDENNDTFGLKSIRLNGTEYDDSNIATISMLNTLQSNLTALQSAYNAHVYQQNIDLADIRNNLASLYSICQALGLDINDIMSDIPKEEEFTTTAGQTVFTATTISWSELNTLSDIVVRRNGQVLSIDPSGGSNRDYVKLNGVQIQLTMDNPVLDDEIITIRVERSLLNPRFNSYFLSNIDGNSGRGIVSPNRYSTNTDRLMVWRNGVILAKSNSIGLPIDRYEETTSKMVTLGELVTSTDVVSLMNRTSSPSFRFYQTGITGTSITVPSYAVGTRKLKVFRNGLLMNCDSAGDLSDQYVETDSTTVTLASAATVDEIFIFECSATIPAFVEVQTGFTGTLITLSSSYTVGDDKLIVFRNGKLMYKSLSLGQPIDRYVESSSNTVTLEEAAQSTDWFTIIYNGM